VAPVRGTRVDREAEGETLLYCLGFGSQAARASRLRQLSDHDWDDVVEQSAKQGIAALLYHRSNTVNVGVNVPTRVTQRLHGIAVGSALKGLRLYQELSQILGVLHDEGIPVIVLKGAYLAEVVYRNVALRSMGDIDLMVRKGDLSRVEAKLLAMGYAQRMQWHIDVDYATHHHLHPLTRAEGVPIEIHWTIERPTNPFTIDIDGLWRRARPARIAGADVLVLCPEDLLLHLCLHTAFDHRFLLGLRACWDIFEIIQHHGPDIDWKQVQDRAREWGIAKYVHLTLQLAKELLGAAVPVQALAALKPNGFQPRLIAWASAEIFAEQTPTIPVSPRLAEMWGARGIREKALLLMKSAFPSPRAMGRMYPAAGDSKWVYLYYPLRWRDLLLQYRGSGWQLIRRNEEAMSLIEREHERAALMDWLKSVD